ncbi:MAG: response regulator transcription factor [Anaerolineae bacterium]|nr:response regulator transcription factor [Anaerolineae bacterium]
MPTILIIEDEPELVKVLRTYLENAGFVVETAFRGDTGLSLWEHKRPDLVLLDLNLPGLDGIDVAREIRRKENTPIVMLTARVEEMDQLIGLELGADDYITKPFSPRVVVAKVRAVLRRLDASEALPQRVRVADIEIDLDEHRVTRAEVFVDVTPTEFELLTTLAAQPGRAFSRLQLLEATQGTAYEGYERTIDAHIKNLRAKLEIDPKNPRYIETIFGIGYRFSRD